MIFPEGFFSGMLTGHDVGKPLQGLTLRRALGLAVSAGGVLAQTTVTSAPPASFTLRNGLQVVVIPDHRTPVVTQMTWYKVGSADETPGKSGLAHFLEHLMFKARANIPPANFPRPCFGSAATRTPSPHRLYGYYQRVPREELGQDDGVRGPIA